jgi:hypothetical protein
MEATFYKACSGKQTSYPQKRQQRLGASPATESHLSSEKTHEKPQLRLVVF